ncbi:MAG: beta-lactamase [Sphingomonas bacterium]|nr:beta-lactamase [Sphingomonas bacterium]
MVACWAGIAQACDILDDQGAVLKIDRRAFIAAGTAGVLAPGMALAAEAGSPILSALSAFVPDYLAARNAPGLILGMADARGWSETARFGVADLEAGRPIGASERFHIGSISKSFAALMIMQLVEEGKVRLDADITSYLPGLPLKTPFGPVTIHHLLCHASGLPESASAAGWPDRTIEQTWAPGSRYYYSNLAYEWLGRVVAVRGGEPWSVALRRRILDPLGMTETSALIGAGMRHLEVPSYARREDDRPYPRMGALTRAAPLSFHAASGCIASTASDMNRYIMMMVRRGQGPNGRLLSAENFALMTKQHIKTGGPDSKSGYGYAWMTDMIDGKPVIRHTGGMESFMSSIHIDLDAGFGAFASINAQQNYRPVPVTAFATKLYRAAATKGAVPKAPVVDPDADLVPADYVGDYSHADGRRITVTASGKRLSFSVDGKVHALESLGDDKFVCRDPAWRLFTFLFTRAKRASEVAKGKANPVLALSWARDSYLRPGATMPALAEGDKVALTPEQLRSYEGYYAVGRGWTTSVRVVVRGGRLWVDSFDGIAPLASLGSDRFRPADEPAIPDTVAFSADTVQPRTVDASGTVLIRLGDPFFELA